MRTKDEMGRKKGKKRQKGSEKGVGGDVGRAGGSAEGTEEIQHRRRGERGELLEIFGIKCKAGPS